MSRPTQETLTEEGLTELAFRELRLSRHQWLIEVILLRDWVGLKVRRPGRVAERSTAFTRKTTATERTRAFLEQARSAVAELSSDPE